MVIERLVWRAKFGQGDQVSQAFSTWRTRYGDRFGLSTRILTDVTGPLFGDAEFQQWFGSWQDAVESGTRELYAVVD
jgi:hypothetical protein